MSMSFVSMSKRPGTSPYLRTTRNGTFIQKCIDDGITIPSIFLTSFIQPFSTGWKSKEKLQILKQLSKPATWLVVPINRSPFSGDLSLTPPLCNGENVPMSMDAPTMSRSSVTLPSLMAFLLCKPPSLPLDGHTSRTPPLRHNTYILVQERVFPMLGQTPRDLREECTSTGQHPCLLHPRNGPIKE